MSTIPLRNVDLNLLVILDVLLRERSVSRASERLHVTPSAVSHALQRLRKLFDDELLVRDGRRMRPTVRAQALSESLPRALRLLEGTLIAPAPFHAASSKRIFRLRAPDFVAPRVLSEVGRLAPEVRVEWGPPTPSAVGELSQGKYDALVASDALHNEGLRGTPVGTWPWRVYGRCRHPAFKRWGLQAWASTPHLQIGTSVVRGQGPIDRRVSELGIERRVGAVVPYFSMAASVVAETDLLLTIPSMSMAATAHRYSLEVHEVPFEVPPMRLSVFRSAIHGDEPGARWFAERVAAACRTL